MKLSDFTMKRIDGISDDQSEEKKYWATGSRSCLIGVGKKDGKKYQVKIHASEPKWYKVDEEINLKKAELAIADDVDKDRIKSELDSLKDQKADRDKRDKVSDQFLEMRQKLVRELNSIGTRLVVANADIWNERIPFKKATYAVEATPWLEDVAVGLTDEDNLPVMFNRDLSEDQQYKIIASLADILSKVHAKGIIHGDLKIGNTLITKEGGEFKAALIDYDAAFILSDLRNRKYPLGAWYYVIGGTYIAPELDGFVSIVREERNENKFKDFDMNIITEKSDIFSLGATIYEYFYGRADGLGPGLIPFVGPDGEVLDEDLYGKAVNFDYKLTLPDTVPDFLFGMINWMMAPLPADRPTAVQVRDAFASANVNMIPSQFTRSQLWEEHRDRYQLTLPDGASVSKGSNPLYRLQKPGSSSTVTRRIEQLVKEGYAVDTTGAIKDGGEDKHADDPALLTKLWPQNGEGKLPTCVRRGNAKGTYQMYMKGVMRCFTYEQLCAEGVICSEADMSTPWPCDAGLIFRKGGIKRDLGLGKGPGYYKIGEGYLAVRRSAKELVNAGDASYGVDIKLHPNDEALYSPNPSAVPSNVSNIFPDPLRVHRYNVMTDNVAVKMMIEELEAKGYVTAK